MAVQEVSGTDYDWDVGEEEEIAEAYVAPEVASAWFGCFDESDGLGSCTVAARLDVVQIHDLGERDLPRSESVAGIGSDCVGFDCAGPFDLPDHDYLASFYWVPSLPKLSSPLDSSGGLYHSLRQFLVRIY